MSSAKTFDERALAEIRGVCRDVDRSLHHPDPVVAVDLLDRLTEELAEDAILHGAPYLHVATAAQVVPVVLEAVRHIARIHAIYPLRRSVEWFWPMLVAYLDLAFPMQRGLPPSADTLFRAIEGGIALQRSEWA